MRRSANNFTPLSLGLTRFCLGRGSCDAHELAFVRARDDRASRLDAALPDIGMGLKECVLFSVHSAGTTLTVSIGAKAPENSQ